MSRSKTSAAEPGFISRWSRRKHEASRPVNAADGTGTDSSELETNADDGAHREASPPPLLTDADMPDIDSLTYESAYADFLSPGVSEKLRKLALRKLFHNEVFNIRDGLDEYDDDFTHFEKLGDIVTSDMRHRMEMEARRSAEQLLKSDEQAPGSERLGELEQTGNRQASVEPEEDGACAAGLEPAKQITVTAPAPKESGAATGPAQPVTDTDGGEHNG